MRKLRHKEEKLLIEGNRTIEWQNSNPGSLAFNQPALLTSAHT